MVSISGNNAVLCQHELTARSFFQRLTGLLTRKFSKELDGMIFENCNAIHTFGMRYSIDVVFYTNDMKICAAKSDLKPFRIFSAGVLKKCSVLELPAGTIERSGCKIGDLLKITE